MQLVLSPRLILNIVWEILQTCSFGRTNSCFAQGHGEQARRARHSPLWAQDYRSRDSWKGCFAAKTGTGQYLRASTRSELLADASTVYPQWEETQDNLKLNMHRDIYGLHAPMRLMMERKIVTDVSLASLDG